ncbi:MAG TPA: sugar ABC transporter permease [Thermomicrobiales bacterium]|nr:sugar ABC transporter permease [Thermomicrobiales bacterium]
MKAAGRERVATMEQPAAVAAARARAARGARLRAAQGALISYLYLLPSLIVFAVFFFYPLVKSVYLSLFASNPFGYGNGIFVGLEQYRIALTSASYRNSLLVTVLYTLYTVPLGLLCALGLAVLGNSRVRGIAIFRTAYALPVSVSVAAGALIFLLMYNPSAGILNYFITSLGMPSVSWLTQPRSALWAISLITIWSTLGFNFIVLLSGLQGIPEELYESARIDGADGARLFRHITLPLLSPSLFFVLVVSTIGAFQSFAQIDLLTRGGPIDSTNVVVYAIYRDAFVNSRVGYASAQAMILFVILLALTAVQFKVLERRVVYQ